MTRSVADWLYRYRWWPWLLTLLFLPGLVVPASVWFSVRSIHVSDSHVGEQVPIVIARTINRPFDAVWSVTIRRWDGGWTAYCVATGQQTYKPDAMLPKAPTLSWWTWGKCHPLPVGKYEITTVWWVDPQTILVPTKRVEVTSNVFEVH